MGNCGFKEGFAIASTCKRLLYLLWGGIVIIRTSTKFRVRTEITYPRRWHNVYKDGVCLSDSSPTLSCTYRATRTAGGGCCRVVRRVREVRCARTPASSTPRCFWLGVTGFRRRRLCVASKLPLSGTSCVRARKRQVRRDVFPWGRQISDQGRCARRGGCYGRDQANHRYDSEGGLDRFRRSVARGCSTTATVLSRCRSRPSL